MSQLQQQPVTGQSQQPTTGQSQQPTTGQGLTGRFFPTQNYLPEQVRRSSVQLLNQTLVDVTVLVTHAKAAHWNVKGPNFFSLHELFEEIYEDLSEHADDIAERVTALGGEAKGTTRVAAANSRIPGLPQGPVTGQEYVQLLAERLAILDAHLGEGIRMASQQDDLDTADLLNEVSREVTKDLWFLEAHLQTQPIAQAGGQAATGSSVGRGQQFQQPQGSQGQQFGGGTGGQGYGGFQQGGPQSFGGGQWSGGGQQSQGVGQQQGQMGQQGRQPTQRQW